MSRPMASSSRVSNTAPRSPEAFESLQRRNNAAEILQSYEKLSWYAFSRGESLTQTRIHFQNVVAGFTDEDEAALVDFREDLTPHPPGGPEQDRMKSDQRIITSGGHAKASSSGDGKKAERRNRDGDSSVSGVASASAKKKRKSIEMGASK